MIVLRLCEAAGNKRFVVTTQSRHRVIRLVTWLSHLPTLNTSTFNDIENQQLQYDIFIQLLTHLLIIKNTHKHTINHVQLTRFQSFEVIFLNCPHSQTPPPHSILQKRIGESLPMQKVLYYSLKSR
jgi:hypothetical protein